VQIRDRLAAQARQRGISLAALLTELATRAEQEAIFAAEREAARADATQAVRDEDRDWDEAIADGLV
jgi:hypothetical protein